MHYISWPDDPPKSAYGPMKRSISAAAGFVINGGAIIPREATPYWRGRSRYVSQFLMQLGCPILYTVHGYGVCEIGASVRMSDDFIVLMLSTDCNRDGAEQVIPILQRAGYKEVLLARSPGPLYNYHEEVPGWMHADMWIMPLDAARADLSAVVRLRDHPPAARDRLRADRGTAGRSDLYPDNGITIEPRKVIMNALRQRRDGCWSSTTSKSSPSNTTKSTNTAAASAATRCS